MAAQTGDQQRVWSARERIDNKIFIDRVVIGAGGAVQTAADPGQDVT